MKRQKTMKYVYQLYMYKTRCQRLERSLTSQSKVQILHPNKYIERSFLPIKTFKMTKTTENHAVAQTDGFTASQFVLQRNIFVRRRENDSCTR